MPCSKCKETGHNMRTCESKVPKLPILTPRRNTRKINWDEALKNEQTRKIRSQEKQIKKQGNRIDMYKKKTEEKNEKIKELERLLKSFEDKKENSEICVVCQEACENSDKHKTDCGHVFHLGCIMPWIKKNNTCPCCREELYKKTDNLSIEEIQNISTGVISMNLNINLEDPMGTNTMLQHGTLFNLGDEIGRQVLEAITDEPLDWEPMTEAYESSDDEPQSDDEHMEEYDLNHDSEEESKHAEDQETVIDESHEEEDIILTPSPFAYERVLGLFRVNEGFSFMNVDYDIFRNHFNVMREMRNRNSFRNAWFQINNEGVRV